MPRGPFKAAAPCRSNPYGSKTARSVRRAPRPDGARESALIEPWMKHTEVSGLAALIAWFGTPMRLRGAVLAAHGWPRWSSPPWSRFLSESPASFFWSTGYPLHG